jgi:hypothetical protein
MMAHFVLGFGKVGSGGAMEPIFVLAQIAATLMSPFAREWKDAGQPDASGTVKAPAGVPDAAWKLWTDVGPELAATPAARKILDKLIESPSGSDAGDQFFVAVRGVMVANPILAEQVRSDIDDDDIGAQSIIQRGWRNYAIGNAMNQGAIIIGGDVVGGDVVRGQVARK